MDPLERVLRLTTDLQERNAGTNHYTFHADPSHAWLKVPFAMVYLLGIGHILSRWSYMSRDCQAFYLEEDRDAGLFLEAYHQLYGAKPEIKLSHTNSQSFVRKLTPYNWDTVLIETARRLQEDRP
jgi:hypothetical protein